MILFLLVKDNVRAKCGPGARLRAARTILLYRSSWKDMLEHVIFILSDIYQCYDKNNSVDVDIMITSCYPSRKKTISGRPNWSRAVLNSQVIVARY